MAAHAHGLLERLREGDPEALAAFIEEHRPQLTGYIERNLGGPLRRKVEPADIFQETSLQALRSFADTDFTSCDPLHWLCHIAEQRIIDAHRKFFGAQKRAAEKEVAIDGGGARTDASAGGLLNLLVASMTSASKAFSRNEKELRLLGALATLPEENQQAIRLRYVEGLPSREIAKRLGKTDGAIRVLLTRSIQRLQQLLEP